MQEFAIVIVENFDNVMLHQIEIKTESYTASNEHRADLLFYEVK